ncbi:MAG: hypothetical protein QG636_143 [Patescibacteria group bacterium]|jgi:type II secretion system protein G|nr:hypothetical protein [Patescibacteria group bacterium]
MSSRNKTHAIRGFTLIELLVVIAIIGMLSSIVLASLNGAREKAKIARAKADIHSLQVAFEFYFDSYNEYPPIGDNCSACSNPCDQGSWNAVVTALQGAGAMSAPPAQDPWGRAYCYDDNYRVPACTYHTKLWSSGPNLSNESDLGTTLNFSGDDFGTVIAPGPQC